MKEFIQNHGTVTLDGGVVPSDADFSGYWSVVLDGCDFSNVQKIKFPKMETTLKCARGLRGNLDFSGTGNIYISESNLRAIQNIKWPEIVDISDCMLPESIDFSTAGGVFLYNMNLSHIKRIVWPKNQLDLDSMGFMPAAMDLSETHSLAVCKTDLSKTKIKWPVCIEIESDVKLPKVINWSNIEFLYVDNSFAGVKKITWPKNNNATIIIDCKLPPAIQRSYDAWNQKRASVAMAAKHARDSKQA